MGDTSSGKSSVLTAISKIEFPSNDKLTTRCPMRLHMARSPNTVFRVYIHWHQDSLYKDKKRFEPI